MLTTFESTLSGIQARPSSRAQNRAIDTAIGEDI